MKMTITWRRFQRIAAPFGLAAALLPAAVGAQAASIPSPISSTQSTSHTEVFVDTPATVSVQTYLTHLLAVLDGTTTVYDQTFALAFSDPIVQSAVAAAQSALLGAGAPSNVTVIGPTLQTQTTGSVGSVIGAPVVTSSTTDVTATTWTTLGPGTVLTGDRGLCATIPTSGLPTNCSGGTLFDVVAGGTNVNVNTNTETTYFRTMTTTNTFLTSASYLLSGTTVRTPVPPSNVPEPASLALVLGALGVSLAGRSLRRRREASCQHRQS